MKSRSRSGRPNRPVRFVVPSRSPYGTLIVVTGLKIGYARVSTVGQDLTAQRDGLAALGVDADRVYVDYADGRVVPTFVVKPLARRLIALGRSA